jgi:hypothetical protein
MAGAAEMKDITADALRDLIAEWRAKAEEAEIEANLEARDAYYDCSDALAAVLKECED